ncbi:MAG TPA: LemA family protein [Thermoanaerobaculia bacterium]|nr:LemA family protein [Thermoanaerobaculia bacterium]
MKNVGLLGCVAVLILIVLIGGAFFVSVRNSLVGLEENVNEQWAQVQSQYQRRFDLIPNLVRTVQGAANFEKSTLEAVVNARARVGQVAAPAGPPGTPSNIPGNEAQFREFEAAQAGLSSALSRLLVVVEQYPDLKSNRNFLELQSQLEGTENRIAVERQRYNTAVRAFNTAIRRFPASVIAGMAGFKQKAYFQGTAGSDQAPDVNFDFSNTATTATTGTR